MDKVSVGQRAHGPLDAPARKIVRSALRVNKKHWDQVLSAHARVKDVAERVAEECQGLIKAQSDKDAEERRAAAQQAIEKERQALTDTKAKLASERTAFQAELRAFSELKTFGEYMAIRRKLRLQWPDEVLSEGFAQAGGPPCRQPTHADQQAETGRVPRVIGVKWTTTACLFACAIGVGTALSWLFSRWCNGLDGWFAPM